MHMDISLPLDLLHASTAGLKRLALDTRCREAFLQSPLLAEVLAGPASRYILADRQAELADKLNILADKGYLLGLEYVGEEVSAPDEVEAIVAEYLQLIEGAEAFSLWRPVQLGFDLSNVGLLISRELAVQNAARILKAAAAKEIRVVLSMERSSMVDSILSIFFELAPMHANLGITLQAHLHRTAVDLERVLPFGRKIRLVKGVYREPADVALPRGAELDERYLGLLERILSSGTEVAVATQDGGLIQRIRASGLARGVTEFEMLHGVQPEVLKSLKEAGLPCRIAAVYGVNWYLHFLHRLAEYPPNLFVALADLHQPERIRFAAAY